MAVIHLRYLAAFAVLLFLGIFSRCTGAGVQFFKHSNFRGEVYKANSSATCSDLPVNFQPFFGSVKATGCVAIFAATNCSTIDSSILVKSEENQVNFTMVSFRNCTEMESRPSVDFDYQYMYGEGSNLSTIHVRNVCACKNLTATEGGTLRITRHGNCLRYYETKDCKGYPTRISSIIEIFPTGILSVEPCHLPRHCVSLNALVYHLEPLLNVSDLVGSTTEVIMDAPQTFTNNGTGIIANLYRAEKEILETANFEYSQSIRQMNSITIIPDIATTIGSYIPDYNAKEELKLAISDTFENNTSCSNKTHFSCVAEKIFWVARRIIVPACTVYRMHSVVEMVKDVEIFYLTFIQITGTNPSGGNLTSVEILEYLEKYRKELEILPGNYTSNDYSVVAVAASRFKAYYGYNNSVVYAQEKLIPECLVNQSSTTGMSTGMESSTISSNTVRSSTELGSFTTGITTENVSNTTVTGNTAEVSSKGIKLLPVLVGNVYSYFGLLLFFLMSDYLTARN